MKKMNEIYEEKERFTRTSLKSLVFDVDKSVLDVYYTYQDTNGEEIVTILFMNGYSYKVRVNGDSLLALARDVLKRLSY